MATKTYEEWEKQELDKAKAQGDTYAVDRWTQADSAAATSNQLYDTAIADAEKTYAASAKETESGYRQLYDVNAVDELVARRNVEEAMANMGLTDSGLNATQQTAISLMRGRADSQASQQKQAAVDAIMRELDSVRTKYETEKVAASRDIYAQADADILSFKNNADTAARTNAASLYTADTEAETARIKAEQEAAAAQYAADQEAATKQAQMLLDAQKNISDERLGMLKLGYQYDETVGGYVKIVENDPSLTIEKQNLIIDYMKQGVSYDKAVAYVNAAFASDTADGKKVTLTNSLGTPFYTTISAQAMVYSKTSAEKATEYIEQQYNAGYITEAQKNELLNKYGYTVEMLAAKLNLYTPSQYGAAQRRIYGTYSNYVQTMLANAIDNHMITVDQAVRIAVEWEKQYGISLDLYTE